MMLVVGGAHSGKRTFVREKLGFAADDFVDAAQLAEGGVPAAFAGRVAYRAEELVRTLDTDRALERLIGFDAVILPLVGSGVVPMRAEDGQVRGRGGRGERPRRAPPPPPPRGGGGGKIAPAGEADAELWVAKCKGVPEALPAMLRRAGYSWMMIAKILFDLARM